MTLLVMLLFLLSEATSEPQVVTVTDGSSVVLGCEAGGIHITAVEWTRDDLQEEYVLFHRDGHCDPVQQHASFRGRVDLADRKLQNGNVSLFLRNTTRLDQGVYRCRVALGGPSRLRRAVLDEKPIKSIQLVVKGLQRDDPTGVNVGLAAAAALASVVLVVLVTVVLFGMFKKHLKLSAERSAWVKTVETPLAWPKGDPGVFPDDK